MKSSEILREAAKLVEQGEEDYGCGAIVEAYGDPDGYADEKPCWKYFRLVGPSKRSTYWWGFDRRDGPRIIGLCLAAAIAESEGD